MVASDQDDDRERCDGTPLRLWEVRIRTGDGSRILRRQVRATDPDSAISRVENVDYFPTTGDRITGIVSMRG